MSELPVDKDLIEHAGPEKELFELVKATFLFSQGNPNFQKNIFLWLKVKGYLDTYQIPLEIPDYINQLAPPKQHGYVTDSVKRNVLDEAWTDLHSVTSTNKESINLEKLRQTLVDQMIIRDYKYQTKERPDRDTTGPAPSDSRGDTHGSFVRRYFVSDRKPAHKAMVAMIEDLRPTFDRFIKTLASGERRFDAPLSFLVKSWEKNHSGENFF